MFRGRIDTVEKISKKEGFVPFGVLCRKNRKNSIYEQDILRLAKDVEASMTGHTLFVTSMRRKEGKTMTAVSLSKMLSVLGRRVLLFYAGTQEMQADQWFHDIGDQGKPLEDYLNGACSIKDIISYDRKDHLYLISTESRTGQLNREQSLRLKELIGSCGGLMDYVIVDGPCMEEGSLPVELAGACDASLLVVRDARMQPEQVKEICAELSEESSQFLGYVLNQTRQETVPPPIWGEMPEVSGKCRRQTIYAGLKKSILQLWWLAFVLTAAFCAVRFVFGNRTYHPLTAETAFDPWKEIGPAALAALMVWMILVVCSAGRRFSIRTGMQVREYLGMRLLAEMPGGHLKNKKTYARYSRAMEKLCAKVQASGGSVLMVTSTVTGEGKSTLAWNLADMLSKQGNRVIVIDADMHEQLMSRWLRTRKKTPMPWDMLDLIEGRAQAENTILQMKANQVYFLGMSREVKQPAVFLRSEAFRRLLSALKESMDYIIIDAPPASAGESEVLARETDGIIYTVGYDLLSPKQILGGVQRMRKTKVNMLGSVLCRDIC